MLTQKGMLRIAEIKNWQIVRTSQGALDLNTGTYYAYFALRECPSFQCRVAQSRIEKFERLVITLAQE